MSKKNCEIARVAPASILRFRLSSSASSERESGCPSGNVATLISKSCRARSPATSSDAHAKPPGCGLVARRVRRRIATERDDVPDAHLPVVIGDPEHFLARRGNAREVRRGHKRRLRQDAPHRAVRALARAAAGAVRHRHEPRRQRLEALDGAPQRLFALRGFRREELERDLEGRVGEATEGR